MAGDVGESNGASLSRPGKSSMPQVTAPPRRRGPSAPALLLTFAAGGLAFLAATVFLQIHAASIHGKALAIAENAGPSIVEVTAARAGLPQVQEEGEAYP